VRAADRWFGGVLGSGFDSMVNERANTMSWPRGKSRYNLAILAELRVFKPLPFIITLDGEVWETEAMLVAVGNGTSYGAGMRVCPGATLDDGLLDVTVLGPVPKGRFIRMFPRVYKGTHVELPEVSCRQAREVRLESPGVVAYADGERFAPLPLTCTCMPGALTVLAP
jgi:diacylglycerol kinase (ATP)